MGANLAERLRSLTFLTANQRRHTDHVDEARGAPKTNRLAVVKFAELHGRGSKKASVGRHDRQLISALTNNYLGLDPLA
jgi:hypothetical protein